MSGEGASSTGGDSTGKHRAEPHPGEPHPDESDLDLPALDDRRDRRELRNRYYGLLQELRVVLPGVQVLLAFLFAVPFAAGFRDLDTLGRAGFGVAMLGSLLAVICMLTPAALHRFGERTARKARLAWSIRMTMVGLGFLAVALIAALWTVARYVYGASTALLVGVPVSIAIPVLWWVLPLRIGAGHDGSDEADADDPADDEYLARDLDA